MCVSESRQDQRWAGAEPAAHSFDLSSRAAALQNVGLSACVALRESEEDAVAAPFLLPATTPQSAQSTSSIDKALAEALHGAGGEMKRSALNKVWQALEGPGELKAHLQSRPRFFTVSARLVKLTSQGVQLLQSQPPERQPLSSSCSTSSNLVVDRIALQLQLLSAPLGPVHSILRLPSGTERLKVVKLK